MENKMERERLGSRLGFILLSAGCAIGLGNVYKFPYLVGQNGGGLFVLIYLAFLCLLGIPVMTMEFAVGRAAQKSPAHMFQQVEKKGSKWHLHGYVCLIASYVLLMCYTTIAGWLIRFFVDTAKGDFAGLDSNGIADHFGNVVGNTGANIFYTGLVIFLAFLVCFTGLKQGLEKITKVMMTALIIIMLVLVGNSLFLEGGQEGLAFYLMPNLDNMLEAGISNVIVAAMNQSFFTLSLGMGAMAIFGSYIGKDRTLLGESINIACLDTFVALASGFIIFPACFAYDVDVTSGGSLIFLTLPNIFNNLPGGQFWGSLFFVFMSFAALSTVFAVFEEILACTMDIFGWGRKKACAINGITLFLLSLPCILGNSVWSDITIFGFSIMDFEDYLVSSWVLPLGSLIFVLFCTSKYGWGWDKYVEEANQGQGPKIPKWMKYYMKYILPLIILAVFLIGIL